MDSNIEGKKLLNDSLSRFVKLINNNLKKSKEIISISESTTQKDLLAFKKEIIVIEKQIGNLDLKKKHNFDNFMNTLKDFHEKIDEISNNDILSIINEFQGNLELLEFEDLDLDESNNLSDLKNRLMVYKNLQNENFDFIDNEAIYSKICELKTKREELTLKLKQKKAFIINSNNKDFLKNILEKINSFKFDDLIYQYLKSIDKFTELMNFINDKQEYFSKLSSNLKIVNKISIKKIVDEFPVPNEEEASDDPRIKYLNNIKEILSEVNYICGSLKTVVSLTETDLLRKKIDNMKKKIEEYLECINLQNELKLVSFKIDYLYLENKEINSILQNLESKIKDMSLNERKHQINFPDFKIIEEKLFFIEKSYNEVLRSFYKNLFTQIDYLKTEDSNYQCKLKSYILELMQQIRSAIAECSVDLKVRLEENEIIKLDGDAF
jgi:hypothetical protein